MTSFHLTLGLLCLSLSLSVFSFTSLFDSPDGSLFLSSEDRCEQRGEVEIQERWGVRVVMASARTRQL